LLNNMAIHKNSGKVYVGGVNRLLQLDPDIRLEAILEDGPTLDSPFCKGRDDCPPGVELNMTDNVNKALLIDYNNSRLISCGSLFQGICTIRSLGNISLVEEVVDGPIVANTAEDSTFAFIAPGPQNHPGIPETQVLYVGVSYTGNSYLRSEVPAITSRSLEPENLLEVANASISSGTQMFINSLARESYPINYVYGFSSGGFSYFLTTQKKRTSSSTFHSRLVRVCQNDPDYYSYTEVPIECTGREFLRDYGRYEQFNYSLAKAAYLGKPGLDLANDLGVNVTDDVLFVVMSTPKLLIEGDEYYTPIGGPTAYSALCIYSLKSIETMFTSNIKRCFDGEGTTGLEFIRPTQQCIKTKHNPVDEAFCGLDINSPLEGELPIATEPALALGSTGNGPISSIATTVSHKNFTLAFLGTGGGYLQKVLIESEKSGFKYDSNLALAPHCPDYGTCHPSQLLLDAKEHNLYMMTDRAVAKMDVQENDCSVYPDCYECLRANNPFCRWCGCDDGRTHSDEEQIWNKLENPDGGYAYRSHPDFG